MKNPTAIPVLVALALTACGGGAPPAKPITPPDDVGMCRVAPPPPPPTVSKAPDDCADAGK